MPHTLPRLSFEHVALAFAEAGNLSLRPVDADPARGAVVPRGPSLRAPRPHGPLPVRRREGGGGIVPGTGRLSWPGRGPPVSFRRSDAVRAGTPVPPLGPRPDARAAPAPFRPARRGRRPDRRRGGEDAPPEGLRRRGRRGIPRGHARRRRLHGAPGHPRLRPPSRGGRSGGFRGPRRDRRRLQPGPSAPGAAPAGRRRRRVGAVVPPGDAAHGSGGSAGGRGTRRTGNGSWSFRAPR